MLKKCYLSPIFLVILVCIGCSGENRPADLPVLYPVTLTILLDDQPLENAMVVLHTDDVSIAKWTVGSYTNAAGEAIIMTHGQFRGAPAGKFKVCVSKQELPGAPTEDLTVIGSTVQPGMGMPTVIHHVDPIFGKRETTPLEVEVPPQRKTTTLTLNVHKPQ